MRTHLQTLATLALLAPAALAGCSDSTAPRQPAPPRVASIVVAPGTSTMQVGTAVQLRAALFDRHGTRLNGRTITWSSADNTLATVSADGVVQGVAAGGPVEITATVGTVSTTALVTIDTREAASIVVDPASVDILPGQTAELRAVVRDAAGEEIVGRQVTWSSSNPGMAAVDEDGVVRAVGQNGTAVVTASLGAVTGRAQIGVLPSPCVSSRPVTLGQPVTGTLSTNDCRLSSGKYAARWRLDLRTATNVRIDLSSAAFDPYLMLTDLDGHTIEVDDDGGPDRDARIAGRLAAGAYIIWASSYTTAGAGSYTLSVATETAPQPCSRSQPLTFGVAVNAYLSTLDCHLTGGEYADRWRLDLSSTTTLRVLMTSSAVDAYVYITDAAGTTVRFDDDGAGDGDAAIATTLPAGTYYVWATSFGANDLGAYRLSVDYEQVSACRSAQPVLLGRGVSGFLGQGDCQLSDGEYADRWRLDLSGGRTVQIDLESFDFDSYVIITDLQGHQIASDDDSGDGSDAHLVVTLEKGSYIIWATSALGGRTGSYDLWVQ